MIINNSLNDTIRNSDLQNVTIEIAETMIDSIIKEGILRDLPIVNSIIGLSKTAVEIKNLLFLKKIIFFLSEIKDIPISKRKKMIDYVNQNEKQQINIGEKLVYLLDKCDDHIDAKYIAQFFCGFLKEEISYQEFLRGSIIIQNIFLGDLEFFLKTDISEFNKEESTEESPDEYQLPLINAGILGFGYNSIKINDHWDVVNGGESIIWLTSIGKYLKEILTLIQ